MELRHLRYFVAVAEELNFTRAAERLHIAQPPLSMQIKVLERELEVTLFDRSKRAVALTAVGRQFLVNARKVLAEAAEAEASAKKMAAGTVGRITIGYISPAATEVFAAILRTFKDTYPQVELHLYDMPSPAQVPALLEGRLDLGIMRSSIKSPQLASAIFDEQPMTMTVPLNHPLAKKKQLKWKDLQGQTMVTLDPVQARGYYDDFFARCHQAGVSVVQGQYGTDIHSVLWLVSAGFGLAPGTFSERQLQTMNMAFCALPADAPRIEALFAWNKNNTSPVLANLLEIMRRLVPVSKKS